MNRYNFFVVAAVLGMAICVHPCCLRPALADPNAQLLAKLANLLPPPAPPAYPPPCIPGLPNPCAPAAPVSISLSPTLGLLSKMKARMCAKLCGGSNSLLSNPLLLQQLQMAGAGCL
ncbi:uncharacterized protein isoform X2 [Leptinotarsa decemlineata]|uniref:uncharacterized protein isoform X2 n=1 Tax=Leptinotarsa decemlineata TaxID=7539 RepID=UPI000C252E52|nr:uncharacterized protein LOC111514286 [Leptinotarsa decemlineata]